MYNKKFIEDSWILAKENGVGSFGNVGGNAKTTKGDKLGKYLTYILYLAPHKQSGKKYNVCPNASKGCAKSCLYTAGRGATSPVRTARINRTKFWFEHRENFKACVYDEIRKHVNRCKKKGVIPTVRLNGTSDIVWPRVWPEIFTEFPEVIHYGYTKNWRMCMSDYKLPKNYYLTLSLSESNDKEVYKVIKDNKNINVAVVFKGEMPKKFWGRKVISGDKHDLRFLDPKGVVVGLTAKGKARYDESGFVRDGKNIPLPTF